MSKGLHVDLRMKTLPPSRAFTIGLITILATASMATPELASASLEDTLLSIKTLGWRSGHRSYLRLRADGTYQGLWRETYSFTHIESYAAIKDGTFTFTRNADGCTAELELTEGDTGRSETKRLRFTTPTSGTLEQDDIQAVSETFSLRPFPQPDGPLLNTSLRCVLKAGDTAHGGFVTTGYHSYLLRVVGPTLKRFLDSPVVERPKLRLFQDGKFMSDFDLRAGVAAPADVLETVTRLVGAFPLQENASDAVVFLYLPPGAYVIEALNPTDHDGAVLIEVYLLPF